MTESGIGQGIRGMHSTFPGRGIIHSGSLSALYAPDYVQRMNEGT
jgi:hypothetical protein